MKKAFVLIAIAALLVCIIPMADSSDATGETKISGFLYGEGKDISTASNINISIVYSNDGENGDFIGTTKTVGPLNPSSKTNEFSIIINPNPDLTISNYYIYFYIYGYSINGLPGATDGVKTIKIEEKYYICYRLSGMTIAVGDDNVIGNTSSPALWFIMKTSEGTVTGKVSTGTDEPAYLNGVRVTLYDLDTKDELRSTVTSNGGEYSISYSTGRYGISYELGGYKTEDMEITIGEEPTTNNVTLKESQSFFGVDLPHALMIIGGSLAIVLLMFTLFMRLRLSKR